MSQRNFIAWLKMNAKIVHLLKLLKNLMKNTKETMKEIMIQIRNAFLNLTVEPFDRVSSEVKDLIRRMIRYPPNERITAQEAYSHIWTQTVGRLNCSPNLLKSALNKLKSYKKVIM